jgi:ABC-type polysaccharide/polyol phosphate transport system ATPase subunit
MYAVSLEGVSKRYRIFPSERDHLKEILSLGRFKSGHEFWALRDVNLKVRPGTALGILGRNGAGKSTLLKVISGVLQPTSGAVRVNGRLVALLQLGAGFNPEFTGRENVMLNGLILGLERKEMLERFDEIEAFADIGEFMNQQVKTYSSGMRARLGFAVAVNVEPDVLIVDETLSVGDAVFKAMGIQRMRELRDSGTTILFVSHSPGLVKDFCTEAVLLHKGSLISHGGTSEAIDQYQALISNVAAQREARIGPAQPTTVQVLQDPEEDSTTPAFKENSALENRAATLRHGTGEARVREVELLDEHGNPVNSVTPESTLTVRVHVQYLEDVDDSTIGIVLRNKVGLDVFSTNTLLEKTRIQNRHAGEQVIVDFTFQAPLKHGVYSVAAGVSDPGNKDLYLDWVGVAAVFELTRPHGRGAFAGLVHLPTQVRLFEPDRQHKDHPTD